MNLVKLFKENLTIPVQLHTHYIGGMAIGACLKAVEAGVDAFDACSGPLAFGSSQPPVETLVRALQGTPWDTGLDISLLFEISNYWEEVRRKRGYERGVTRITDMKVFDHQVPGGMISNLVSQLEEQNALHRINEVLEEIPKVRADLGYPPLVTPTSQIVGIQAVLNVLTGSRYKMTTQEVKKYVKGYYGRPPAPIAEDIQKMIIGDEEPITCRPADLLENKFEKMKEEIRDLAESEEDYITYALFPAVARKFFEYRKKARDGEIPQHQVTEDKQETAKSAAQTGGGSKPRSILLDRRGHQSSMEEGTMDIEDIKDLIKMLDQTSVNEVQVETAGIKVAIRKGITGGQFSETPINTAAASAPAPAAEKAAATEEEDKAEELPANLVEVTAPMVGTFYRAPSPDSPPYVEIGSTVKKGDTLCIIEAMKLMNEIEAECDGKIVDILVENAQPVEYGQVLFLIAPAE